jgi:hypothetical protein
VAEQLLTVPTFAEHPAACAVAMAALDRLIVTLDQLPADRYGAQNLADACTWSEACARSSPQPRPWVRNSWRGLLT